MQRYKCSSWMASLIDILALGSSVDDQREVNCSSIKPLFPTRSLGLPYKGSDVIKLLFISLLYALRERLWVLTTRPAKKIHSNFFLLKRWMFSTHINVPMLSSFHALFT